MRTPLVLFALLHASTRVAHGQCLAEEMRPITPAQQQFRADLLRQIRLALVVPPGWTVRDSMNPTTRIAVCPNDPVPLGYRLRLHRDLTREEEASIRQVGSAAAPTAAVSKAEADKLQTELVAVADRMTKAYQAGNAAEAKRLQQEYNAVAEKLKAAMERQSKAYSAARSAEAHDRDIEWQVYINHETLHGAGTRAMVAGAAFAVSQDEVVKAQKIRTIRVFFGAWRQAGASDFQARLTPGKAAGAQSIVVQIKAAPERADALLRELKTQSIEQLIRK